MALYWQIGDPKQLQAACDRQQAELLLRYDHHRVVVQDRWGILITYHWMPLEEALAPLRLKVIFHPAPHHQPTETQVRTAIKKHPLAPSAVQAIIDGLEFSLPLC